MRRCFHLLRRDERGAALIEFALLVPVMFGLILGVLQVGLGMQAYNSLRGIASDTARYAVTSYQASNARNASTITNYGRTIATQSPYGLKLDDLDLRVTEELTPRVTGTREFTISIEYNVPSLLGVLGMENIPLSYERPIFVID
jgi:Flp pilus assembly protein TadG